MKTAATGAIGIATVSALAACAPSSGGTGSSASDNTETGANTTGSTEAYGVIAASEWLGEPPVIEAASITETLEYDVVIVGGGHSGTMAAIGFMKPLDIVSVFGNAIDNAMLAVAGIDTGHREITIRTLRKAGWVVLRFENEFATPLKWSNGKLVSTKPGPSEHGQGIAIIEDVVAEYGGNVSIDVAKNRFALNILFPDNVQPCFSRQMDSPNSFASDS